MQVVSAEYQFDRHKLTFSSRLKEGLIFGSWLGICLQFTKRASGCNKCQLWLWPLLPLVHQEILTKIKKTPLNLGTLKYQRFVALISVERLRHGFRVSTGHNITDLSKLFKKKSQLCRPKQTPAKNYIH